MHNSACLQQVGRGPDLGDCADLPEGAYTWGEAGIGTCLAGPSDMQFFEQDGRVWLGVVNANPWLSYRDGSLLLIDWASVDPSRVSNPLHDLEAYALSMDRFVGGFGYVPGRELGLVSGRLSEDSLTRSHEDDLWIVDLADPTAPRLWAERPQLTLKDDPQPVVVDAAQGLAYVVNLTDHSISVIDTEAERLRLIDVAPAAAFTTPRWLDASGAGAQVELADARALPDRELTNDEWTLAWVPGSTRLWVPDGDGVTRYSTGGGPLIWGGPASRIAPSGVDGLFSLSDPWMTLNAGVPELVAVDGGQIIGLRATGSASSWDTSAAAALLTGRAGDWDAWPGGPSIAYSADVPWLAYDGRMNPGEPASIGLARWEIDAYVRLGGPALVAPSGESYEDPFLVVDPQTGGFRMWFSHFTGTNWQISLSESADGAVWSAPRAVLRREGGHAAAPAIVWAGHRYEAWLAIDDGARWAHARAWSFDGVHWSEPEWALPADPTLPLSTPARAGVLHAPVLGFTLAGANTGRFPDLVSAGSAYSAPAAGMSFRVVVGHAAPDDLFESAERGLTPGSVLTHQGNKRLYVTLRNRLGQARLAVIEQGETGWHPLADDLIPAGTGGNDTGAEAPVVWADAGGFVMLYSATDAFGVSRIREARSADGLVWSPTDAPALAPRDFDLQGQRPAAVEPLDDGSVRLWYTGDNGSRQRIGSARRASGGGWEAESGLGTPWQLGAGTPGAWDDTDVASPTVLRMGDQLHIWYAGFDGESWSIGHAVRPIAGGAFKRDTSAATGLQRAALKGQARTFSAAGVGAPVVEATADGVALWYAGLDGFSSRLGRATGDGAALFPTSVLPGPGDTMTFRTRRGETGRSVIELEQTIDGFNAPGIGVSSARLDEERGFLFITSKLSGWIYVVDVRDDSDGEFVDHNAFDLEALLFPSPTVTTQGFRDAIPVPGTNLLYATARRPDEVVVFDLSQLEDLGTKRRIYANAVHSFPMQAQTTPTAAPTRFGETVSRNEDAGAATLAALGPTGLALSLDNRFLLSTHFRDNSVTVFDRAVGAYGERVRDIPSVGENPHLIRVSPDGRYAVVANFAGQVDESQNDSTLAIIDIDPTSPTSFQVVSWITNR